MCYCNHLFNIECHYSQLLVSVHVVDEDDIASARASFYFP